MKTTMAKPKKNPTVLVKKATASFLWPSRYSCRGSDKNKNPIIAADKTKRLSITIGIRIDFCGKKGNPAFPTSTPITIYKAAAKAYVNGFFIGLIFIIILSFTPLPSWLPAFFIANER